MLFLELFVVHKASITTTSTEVGTLGFTASRHRSTCPRRRQQPLSPPVLFGASANTAAAPTRAKTHSGPGHGVVVATWTG